MTEVFLQAVGLYAPGLIGWEDSLAVLRGDSPYEPQPLPRYRPALLPSNERRRATDSVRLAFGACEDAIRQREADARDLAAVFASSGGDYRILDQICCALLRQPVQISPTQFHNSVHNAPAGYWSIASECRAPSVSLATFDFGVGMGLLEAVSLASADGRDVLLVLFDPEVCPPLREQRAVTQSFAAALWLSPTPAGNSMAHLEVSLDASGGGPAADCPAPLRDLQAANPAARVLPLLVALARGESCEAAFALACGSDVRVQMSVG
ncbi:MAG: hypothetical protein CME59_10205 [Halioglobus sp.]|nr:hypothetical protein [Halioglobus sp.]